jgi:hypothetical protein
MPRGENFRGRKIGGRQKGTPNKVTATLKEMILGALDQVGGESYLVEQSEINPNAFIALLGRLVPSEIKASLASPPQSFVKIDLEALGRVTDGRDSASSDQGDNGDALVQLGDAPQVAEKNNS